MTIRWTLTEKGKKQYRLYDENDQSPELIKLTELEQNALAYLNIEKPDESVDGWDVENFIVRMGLMNGGYGNVLYHLSRHGLVEREKQV